METLELILQIIIAGISSLVLLLSIPLFFAFRWPAPAMWFLKVIVSAVSPLLFLFGLLTAIIGWTTSSLFMFALGLAVLLIHAIHYISITRPPAADLGFKHAFGNDWENQIAPSVKSSFLATRTAILLPRVPAARMQQNFVFATLPGNGRELLCDLWQSPVNVTPSGTALIFLHGSAFYFLDKDLNTRPFFNHLAAQGHFIMDVAYRLAPETDIMGMTHDVKRAIHWLKEHAADYNIDPERIIVSGGSAGGHLALLAAYTSADQQFSPADLLGSDTSVLAVISIYGTSDLVALYYHTNQHLTTRDIPGKIKKSVPTKMPGWMVKAIGKDYHRLGLDKRFENIGTLAPLMGGHPDEVPGGYTLQSPVTHIHPQCPTTLLIHGAHDIMSPVASARKLYKLLVKQNIPAVLHIIPQSDHAFDLALPRLAPAAHNAIYDIERFIALVELRKQVKTKIPGKAVVYG